MGLVSKPAFTAGELDPSLWERTNLDKYRNGLAAARSWIISKTGSILTRPGRKYVTQCKLANRSVILYSPPGSGIVMEWGHLYVRVYSLTTLALTGEIVTTFQESDLANLHFDISGSLVFVFCAGKAYFKLNYVTGITFSTDGVIIYGPFPPTNGSLVSAGTPAGYDCDYAISYVQDGQEGPCFPISGTAKLPIASGQTVTVNGTLFAQAATTNKWPGLSEMRVYRRPTGAGAFGYLGSTTNFSTSGGNVIASFLDIGSSADYTHQPPSSILPTNTNSSTNASIFPGSLLSYTGLIYQQRLILTDYLTDLQAMYASQPGYLDNFNRNYPLDNSSALKFKAGTSGYARVLRMLDSDGLVAFTSAGIFLNQGELGPNNLALAKKGKWIIDPVVPPLAIPGGVMFLDSMTNGIRNLLWSFQQNAFDADEVSIYSNHLFRTRVLKTWCFQQGVFPVLWVVFTDGSYASFTYDYNQQMQAWTRHDGVLFVESCCGTINKDQTFFVVKKVDSAGNTQRYIELTLPRYATPQDIASDPDYDKNSSCAYMDSIVSTSNVMNTSLSGTDGFTFTTTQLLEDNMTPDWGGILNLSAGTSNVWNPLVSYDGAIYRFFDEDGSAIDVKFVQYLDRSNIQVQVDNVNLFPESWAVKKVRLYRTITQVTGLGMMEGEYPGVIVDGAVLCSPNNDQQNYPELQVVGGVLTFPTGVRGAIVHVGRPIVGDLETLDIDTVEQQPTLIESETVNKVYVKIKDAKSLYIGPKFPNGANGESTSGVTGMYEIENFPVNYEDEDPIIGNRAQPSTSKRYEITLNGDWSQQGKICVRQVDPVHAEILSIIPDVEVERRVGD